MKLVMFAWGNPSRGDDGVGPWFADRFGAVDRTDFRLVEDFQLQVEHLLDCEYAGLLLFVDACCDSGSGDEYRFREIGPTAALSHTSHQLTPQELLGYYHRVFKQAPPPAFLLTVPGQRFELGANMSAATLACCERAARLADQLLRTPRPRVWREYAGAPYPESGHA